MHNSGCIVGKHNNTKYNLELKYKNKSQTNSETAQISEPRSINNSIKIRAFQNLYYYYVYRFAQTTVQTPVIGSLT